MRMSFKPVNDLLVSLDRLLDGDKQVFDDGSAHACGIALILTA